MKDNGKMTYNMERDLKDGQMDPHIQAYITSERSKE